jgi:hypothetical protein
MRMHVDSHQALLRLNAYLQGALTLEALIDWAEGLEAAGTEDAWLARVAADLANPLLCREQATALVREHLRARAPTVS